MTHTDSPEVQQLLDKRSGMTHRLLQLRDAGLPTQFALAMFRYAIAGDATFLARTCGIPPRAQIDLDRITTRTSCTLLHADDITETTWQRIFLPTRLGGLGMWSATTTARAAFTASSGHERPPKNWANSSQGWARYWGISKTMPISPTRRTTTLRHCTPWPSKSINVHYPRRTLRVPTNKYFNPWQATTGQQHSFCRVEVQEQGLLHFHPEHHARRWTTNRLLLQPDCALGFRWEITSHTATKSATTAYAAPNSMKRRPTH